MLDKEFPSFSGSQTGNYHFASFTDSISQPSLVFFGFFVGFYFFFVAYFSILTTKAECISGRFPSRGFFFPLGIS